MVRIPGSPVNRLHIALRPRLGGLIVSELNRFRAAVVLVVLASGMAIGQGRKPPIKIDGSSTVGPSMMVAAEMFGDSHMKADVTVGVSGTGGGFKKFLEAKPELRTDINNASRPISAEEMSKAATLGVEFIELPISYDGLTVVVNPKNTFCDFLTVVELRKIWEPGSRINNWKDIRPGFPDLPLKLYGAGTDSGTFDYFTEAIVGKAKQSRSDYNASEDDNVLVQGVIGDPGALGYFGYSYFEANKNKLKALKIDAGNGNPVAPSMNSIRDGSYSPLSRPLFIYVNKQSAQRPEVRDFVRFLLSNAKAIVEHETVRDVALSDEVYAALLARFENGTTGSVFAGQATHAPNLTELYKQKE